LSRRHARSWIAGPVPAKASFNGHRLCRRPPLYAGGPEMGDSDGTATGLGGSVILFRRSAAASAVPLASMPPLPACGAREPLFAAAVLLPRFGAGPGLTGNDSRSASLPEKAVGRHSGRDPYRFPARSNDLKVIGLLPALAARRQCRLVSASGRDISGAHRRSLALPKEPAG
jgi:hypothetical protein